LTLGFLGRGTFNRYLNISGTKGYEAEGCVVAKIDWMKERSSLCIN
jgi:hypothetical protein